MTTLTRLVLLIALVCATTVLAETPRLISYQGQLTDATGTPLSGSYSIRFSIYAQSSGGSSLWSETRTVSVSDGAFKLLLGESISIPETLFDDDTRYLGIKVGTDSELTPRSRLAAVPYAFNSNRLNGVSGDDYAYLPGDNLFSGSINNFQ